MNSSPTIPERKKGRKKKWNNLRPLIIELGMDPDLSYEEISRRTGVPKTTVFDYLSELRTKESRPALDSEDGHDPSIGASNGMSPSEDTPADASGAHPASEGGKK